MRRYLSPKWLAAHALVLLAVLVCLRLAWWQLDRSGETDGSVQNLGYALLWPAFGVTFLYMWVRFLRLEREREVNEQQEHAESLDRIYAEVEGLTRGSAPQVAASGDGTPSTGVARAGQSPANGASDFVGVVGNEDEDDPELAAYNRALAALAEKDRRAR